MPAEGSVTCVMSFLAAQLSRVDFWFDEGKDELVQCCLSEQVECAALVQRGS